MKTFLLAVALLNAVYLHAQQQEAVFNVKKPAPVEPQLISGIYCSEFRGDGRLCFHFDSLGMVEDFVGGKNLRNIPQQVGMFNRYKAPYTLAGDTLLFTVFDSTSSIVNGRLVMQLRTISYTGVLTEGGIDFTADYRTNGTAGDAVYLKVQRVKE